MSMPLIYSRAEIQYRQERVADAFETARERKQYRRSAHRRERRSHLPFTHRGGLSH